MKSYFAKLADRATLGKTLRASPAHTAKAPDPFEAAPSPVVSPASEIPKARETSTKPGNFQLPQPAHDTQHDSVQFPDETGKLGSAEPPVASTTIVRQRAIDEELHLQAQLVPQTSLTNHAVEKVKTVRSSTEAPVHAPQLTPPETKAKINGQNEQPSIDETAAAEERLTDLERGQAVLLRKADAFMGRLLSGQTESPLAEGMERPAEPRNVPKADAEHEHPNWMQPNPVLTRQSREDSDRPSLVIGKLTVEVIPAAPPPIAPKQRVIIVQSARSRTAGPISGQRFGLGQF